MVSARNWSGSIPSDAGSESVCASSQRLSCGPSTSGWNWTARCRPMPNACTATSLRASTVAAGGGRQRSWWNSSQGPAGTRSWSADSTSCQPISRRSIASTRPPNAAHSAWAPKQMPSTGTPARSAARSQVSSSAIQGSGSLTELTAPSTTMRSAPPGAGSGPSSGSRWTDNSAPRASNASAMKPAESMSWCRTTITRSMAGPPGAPLRSMSFRTKLYFRVAGRGPVLRRLVAGLAQQPTQVDHHLLVDVLALGMGEERALRPDPDGHLAVVMYVDRADRVQQRGHRVPLDVVADRVLEDLAQRVAVAVVEVL